MQKTVFHYVIWFVEVACLLTIIYASWLLVDRPVFALITAAVLLATCLWLETRTAD